MSAWLHWAARSALVGNVAWNLAGTVLPLAVGLVTIPLLLAVLGIERFGLLSLIWILTGYFGLLDLGMSRALTKLVAENAGSAADTRLARDVWTGLGAMSAVGLAGALVLGAAANWLARALLNIPESMQTETVRAIWFLVPSIPVTIAAAGLRGVMEGLHLFRLANLIRMPLAALTFLAPLAVALITPDLALISASLLGVRILGLIAHWVACVRALPALARPQLPDSGVARLLLGFGGWLTVTNVVGPLMTYLDRFVVGAVADMAAVAHYATPYDLVTKLLLVPFALSGVLFPVFSGALQHGTAAPAALMTRSLAAVFAVIFPVVVVMVAFAREGMGLWLGDEFASHSYRVLQWLAAGVLVNAMAQVPFAYLQSAGRPDWIAKLHLAELPLYLAVLWWLLATVGIVGAAIAWTGRVVVDAIALLRMARAFVPAGGRTIPPRLVFAVLLGMAALIEVALLESPLARGGLALLSAVAMPALVWRLIGRGLAGE